ncbi:nuclear transport factor 2 family protein [Georgenia sp. Z1344]|uniref:nuclear transport factor 2 family protein n=1 Tax=Georgenia sp. Z1344 TaxID=3416706 RepID=UPI003CF9F259
MGTREQVADIMAALARGDRRPLIDAMRDDVTWRWMGVERWSHEFVGKDAVVGELFGAVDETLDVDSATTVHRIMADGDHVVVEHTGTSRTPDGRAYDNNYCWVLDLDGAGAIRTVREYMDTDLVTRTFGADDHV